MGVTYQTNNRQRRKVMTAPLNAPPEELVGPGGMADAPALDGLAPRSGFRWILGAIAGAAVAAYVLHVVL